jgi:protein SCO1/2
MRQQVRAAIAPISAVWLIAAAIAVGLGGSPARADNTRWGAGYFPNVTLTTQDGAPVRFYDDLLKGKIVAINLIYTTCQFACPLETARMAQVQRLIGDRMGKDVFFYSITIDPTHDTPAVLKDYAAKYHAGPGWLFLTGSPADIELISRKIGLYSEPDPRNQDGHMPSLLVGNEATGQWMRNSALDNPKFLARTIGDWLNSWQTAKKDLKSYADAPRLTLDRGQYTFNNHCAACHTIGKGDQIGPDLMGVTTTRDRSWLSRFIVAPDKMLAAGDPIAVGLLDKYKQVRMPSLGLNESDAAAILSYLDGQNKVTAAPSPAPVAQPPAARRLNMGPIIDPYIRIQRALNADRLDAVKESAVTIAAGAAALGPAGESIQAAAGKFAGATDLKAARAVFGKLSDAVMITAKDSGTNLGADVKVAFCPMLGKYWLQKGETIQNPFYGQAMSTCGRIDATLPDLQ